jgi:uroporphyrin-III C-methyltransferase/precorrin-2 dehydrogenase/sirohydrochlorin ferrochelatase
MESLPLFLRLAGRPVLLLGEGEAAEAKARLVEEAGGRIVREPGPDVRLAFIALAEGAEDAAARCRAQGLLVNVVDRPELCDFTVPAIVDRSPVLVAVGTGGASASLAKALKERLEILLPAGLGRLAEAIRAARAQVAVAHRTVAARRDFWAAMLAPAGPLDPLRDHDDPAALIAGAAAAGRVETSLTHIRLAAPDGLPVTADRLTLGMLRLLAQADLVVHDPAVPAEVLAFIRRDAARLAGTDVPDDARGRILLLTLDETNR